MKQAVFNKSLTISIRPEVFDLIKEITDVERISISEWFRAAADAALEKTGQIYELFPTARVGRLIPQSL